MKYIRTKDGIIYVGDLIKDEYGNYCDPKNYENDMEIGFEYNVKEADTIEELCDEFVLKIDDKIHQIILGETTLKDEINIIKHNKLHKIYGAIWTDKGLIYVAKMNENGVLELI